MTGKRKFPFMQIDAFTDRPLGGNPCAVVFDADGLDDATMLAVARETNLSETAFVMMSDVAQFALRFFTPVEEIPMAGHPTIAAVHGLVTSGRLELTGDRTRIALDLTEGPIHVEVETEEGSDGIIRMWQRRPEFLRTWKPDKVLPAFGLETKDLLKDAPIQTVSTGTPQLMVPVKSLDALKRAQLDREAYAALRAGGDFFSPHLFCLQGATSRGDTFARHFMPPPEAGEDPFTGSATGAMACYLWHHELIDKREFVAEQGHWLQRPGHARVAVIGEASAIEAVSVAGRAVSVIEGVMTL